MTKLQSKFTPTDDELYRFVQQSNAIEGIRREPLEKELKAHRVFLDFQDVGVEDLTSLLAYLEPGARLRDKPGLDVTVGNHTPPPGGKKIPAELSKILADVPTTHPYEIHTRYETLHPFTDGNGRTGRALWAWQMVNSRWHGWGLSLGFLHAWYYQSLSEGSRGR